MTRPQHNKRAATRRHGQDRNTQNIAENKLRQPAAPKPPVVAKRLLAGETIGFVDFLGDTACERFCSLLFGEVGTSAGTMLAEFRQATDFPAYYYGKPGKLTDNAKTKRLLKKFARRAYRGDPDSRGVAFWERVAWLLWNAYAALMALRERAEKIRQQEIQRIASLPVKRSARAAYMRRYRAKRDNKQGAKLGRYFKPGAKQRWRNERAKLKS